ncbi:MAG TPA: rhodanese-related sulfurtransferase [Candidatus Paceibacterota bacterium]|nr:rhodanese-related sulfurtransferase [Candidatus Paceibacterota bacterium]
MNSDYTILLFYKYVKIEDPEAVRLWQKELCERLALKGRIIIAQEGINATLEGKTADTEAYWRELASDPRFAGIHLKKSEGTGSAFPKLSVKVRPEIVSLHLGKENDVDPNQVTGKRLKPEELREWIKSGKKFHIVDMRNGYEHAVGHFEGSVLPDLGNFRDLPKVVDELKPLVKEPILTVCTGGVRCEKASGYLVKEGFEEVYQLDGGIVSYMEKYPNQDFKGQLYVFDGRVTMGFDLNDPNREIVGRCDKCESLCETYADCADPGCHRHFLCCSACRDEEGRAWCDESCRQMILS